MSSVARGKIIAAGILRCNPTTGQWYCINDADHAPVGVLKVETLQTEKLVRVWTTQVPAKVGTVDFTRDETFLKNGIDFGASMEQRYFDMYACHDYTTPPRSYLDPTTLGIPYSNVGFEVIVDADD